VGTAKLSNLDELETVMKTYVRGSEEDTPVVLKIDQEARWGTPAQVLGRLQTLGFTQVGMTVEPETRR
ncbi:MAG: hypothetical protein PVH00_15195, partial [Gemmatimonadota bacterium]